jgi:hypothetical protein
MAGRDALISWCHQSRGTADFPVSFGWRSKLPPGSSPTSRKSLKREVLDEGHDYFVVRSIDDVEKILKEL